MRYGKRWTAVGLCLLANGGGCAEWKQMSQVFSDSQIPDVRPLRKERADDMIRTFDRSRNDAQFQAAQACWRQGDYDQARDLLQKIVLRDPAHRDALFLLADVHLERDRPSEAVEVMQAACQKLPDDAEAAYRFGLALEANNQFDDAVTRFQQAASARPDEKRYCEALVQAQAYVDGEADRTPRPASEILNEEPASVQQEFAAALNAWKQGRDDEAALRLTRFLAKRPGHIEAEILQSEIDLTAGRSDPALARIDRLAKQHPRNAQVLQACGLLHEAAGDETAAEQYFASARAATARGEVVPAGHQEAAASDEPVVPPVPKLLPAPEAVRLVPTEANEASVNAAAESRATSAAATDPEMPLDEGRRALDSGDTADAKRLLTAAVARERRVPQTAIEASSAALKAEQPELAFELASAGITAFPRSAPLHRIRGWASYRLGRLDEARESLERSLSLDNSQGLSYFLLGSVMHRLGDAEEAQRNFREAARLDPRYAVRK